MRRKLAASFLLLGCSAAAGCNGYVQGSGEGLRGHEGGGPPGHTPDTPIPTADAIALLTDPPLEPVVADITCTDQAVVPRGRIWRLSGAAFKNAVKHSVGYGAVELRSAPLDGMAENKFSTSARQNVVSQPWADWFFAQGEAIGGEVAGALPVQHQCMLAAGASAACVQGFIEDYAGRMFRRPLTADELARYQAAYGKWLPELGPQEATRALVQAWTMSPNHVFRTELGDRRPGKVELTQHELASQISFSFANSAPDALLLADAQQGKLADPAVVRAHAERLLQGPGGHEVLQGFFYEFLHQRELAGGGLEDVDLSLVAAMQAETASFVENVIFTQGGGLDVLLSSTRSTIEQPLATLYGVAAGSAIDTKRPGLLHQAAFLNTRRDATRRGLFVAGELLCSPPPPIPPDAAEAASKLVFDEDATGRQIQQVIQSAGAVCASCHQTFAPLGLAFERYDEHGKYRERHNGVALDVTGSFIGTGDVSGSFADSADMVGKIVASDQGQLCFTKRFIGYLQGRSAHGVLDGCLISRARDKMVEGKLSPLSLMLELTQDPSFYRRINLED